ncbi:hypothetical protein SHKM778_91700 [Streptomyces sp. KM77-8]|uniref:PrsW family intramembrane metalloprotease n=1 Tax=Streptomyces haneummycinicus TaxID=3074435 RepID=A0AAT9I086_9ACTN
MLTGIGFGVAALSPDRQRIRRVLLPLAGLLLAMGMHALWNGSTTLGQYGFIAVYAAFMVPVFGLLTWLVVWTRQRELRTVRAELPAYVAAGWLNPAEPFALGSMRARRLARGYARQYGGRAAARSMAEYEAYATSLAFLRHRGGSGGRTRTSSPGNGSCCWSCGTAGRRPTPPWSTRPASARPGCRSRRRRGRCTADTGATGATALTAATGTRRRRTATSRTVIRTPAAIRTPTAPDRRTAPGNTSPAALTSSGLPVFGVSAEAGRVRR